MEEIPNKRPRQSEQSSESPPPAHCPQESPSPQPPNKKRSVRAPRSRPLPPTTRHSELLREGFPSSFVNEFPRKKRVCPGSAALLFERLSGGDDSQLLTALKSLSLDLAVSSEDILSVLPIEELVAALIDCLQRDAAPEIVLAAISCLVHLLDLAPTLSGVVGGMGGITVLAGKLQHFEFIDLAENAVKLLERISLDCAVGVLREGAFGAMVRVLEFFDGSCQLQILHIALNIVRTLATKENYRDFLVPSLGTLIGLLSSQDLPRNSKVLEVFTTLAETLVKIYRTDVRPELDSLHAAGLTNAALAPELAPASFRLLNTLCKYSPTVCGAVLALDVASLIISKISGDALPLEALQLVDSLLPSARAENPVEAEKKALYTTETGHLQALGGTVLPRLLCNYEHYGHRQMKLLVMQVLEKLATLSPAALLLQYAAADCFFPFVADLLGSEEFLCVRTCLDILDCFYSRVPQEVAYSFTREGLLDKVKKLRQPETLKQIKLTGTLPGVSAAHLRRFLSAPNEMSPQLVDEMVQNLRKHRDPRDPRDPREVKEENRQQLVALANSVLSKHKAVENNKALAVCKELKNLALQLDRGRGDCAGVWRRLAALLASDQLSHFEFTSAGLAAVVWKWLAAPQNFPSGTQQFCGAFLGAEHGLSDLAALLIGCVRFVRNFPVTSDDLSPFSCFRAVPKVKVSFVYSPTEAQVPPELRAEFEAKHALFSTVKKFNVTLDTCTTLESIKLHLLRAQNKEDLKRLRSIRRFEDTASAHEAKLHSLLARGVALEDAARQLDTRGLDKEPELRTPTRRGASEPQKFVGLQLLAGGRVLQGDNLMGVSKGDSVTVHFRLIQAQDTEEPALFLETPRQLFEALVRDSEEIGLDANDKAAPYLKLLKLLFAMNCNLCALALQVPPATLASFRSPKLTALLSKQLMNLSNSSDVWAYALPRHCKFLFPFTVRKEYLYSNLLRGNLLLEGAVGPKHKVSVNRENLLECALCIFSGSALIRQGPLELEYEGEVGTGLGPTLEFYTLLSGEIRQLGLWRDHQEQGLFPAPLEASDPKACEYFTLLGKLTAKALIDRKQLDLPLSPVWWKLVLGQELTVFDIQLLDPVLFRTLKEFQELAQTGATDYRGAPLESLGVTFTLPGYDAILLKPHGASLVLSAGNLAEYVSLVSQSILLQTAQAAAFRRGVQALVPLECLNLFFPSEMELLCCGDLHSQWDLQTLHSTVCPDHGYSGSSETFQNLLLLMSSFDYLARRQFLCFITGSPRLPIGGFARLCPKLTVVKKEPTLASHSPDQCLPSVMTCQNYLKVPEYSSYGVLEERVRYAMTEGHQAFHLS